MLFPVIGRYPQGVGLSAVAPSYRRGASTNASIPNAANLQHYGCYVITFR